MDHLPGVLPEDKPKENAADGAAWLAALEIWNPDSAFNAVFGSFLGALVLYDFAGGKLNFLRGNARFFQVTGHSCQEFSAPHADVLPWIQAQDAAELACELERREAVTLEARWLCEGGPQRWLRMKFQPLGQGRFLCAQEDVTAGKLSYQLMSEAAKRDAMTGLLNRTAFEQAVEGTISVEPAVSSAFIMLDLDNFKQINDLSGHLCGDHVLRQVSKLLQKTIRGEDFMARLGGDEFAIFMRHIPSVSIALERAQFLCGCIYSNFAERNISCSAGIALYPRHGAGFSALYQCADEALYEAKKRGKNQSVVADTATAHLL